MASGGFRSCRLAALVLTGLLVAAASGCATAPSGGAPQRLKGQSGQQQAFVQPLPPPGPTRAWTAQDVVHGFLAASANFNLDPAAARLYLAPGVSWHPRSSDITVVGTNLTVTREPPPARLPGNGEEKITVSGQRLASLSGTGQYDYEQGTAAAPTYTFKLAQNNNGIWLIESLPPGDPLLLTQPAFEQVFQPRNLYFYGPSQNFLVPDPVFAPLQGPATANASILATGLVKGLLVDSGSWLSAATTTAFPTGTTCSACVTVNNLTALVSLQVPTPVSQSQVNEMYAQLSKTLTSNSYLPPVVTHVRLELNGRVRHADRAPGKVPAVGTAQEYLYFAAAGLMSEIKPNDAVRPVAAPAQLAARPPITALAVSRNASPQLAIAVPNGKGCGLFVGSVGRTTGYTYYRLSGGGGACTSLSWDSGQNLWAVAGTRMWVLRPRLAPLQVTLPVTSLSPSRSRVMALRMAPDGVRAALLVRTPTGSNRLLLAAVAYAPNANSVTFGNPVPVGANLPDPTAVSWYSPDELVVVDGPDIYEVPLTGGLQQQLGSVPGRAVSITSTGHNLAIGTNAGLIWTSPAPNISWQQVSPAGTGAAQAGPVYPG